MQNASMTFTLTGPDPLLFGLWRDLNARGKRITGLADGVDDGDAVTIRQARTIGGGGGGSGGGSYIPGPQGPKGDKGDQGEPGTVLGEDFPTDFGLITEQATDPSPIVKGPVGDKGPQGDQGIKGVTGDKGPVGDQGAKGPTGDQGMQGPVGNKGATGDKGPTGDKGATGDKGPQGDPGNGGSTATPINIQMFDASGTWTKPAGAKRVDVFAQGAGAGGSSGDRRASGTVSIGGYGGPSGGQSYYSFDATALPSSVSVEVGAGGLGGAAVTTDSTVKNPGSAGGDCRFGTSTDAFFVLAGGGGAGGQFTSGAVGLGYFTGIQGGIPALSGGAGPTPTSSYARSMGGGAGAGHPTTPATNNGGMYTSNIFPDLVTYRGSAGVGATKQDAIGPSLMPSWQMSTVAAGGPGGWCNADGTAGPGANGLVGAGGGGGGASLNGNPSGKGGNGGPGRVVVVTHF